MGIEVIQTGPVVVVAPGGDLDSESGVELKRTLEGILGEGHARIVVDLSRVGYIDSSIWGGLAAAAKRAHEAGGGVRLCAVQGEVLAIYVLTRLSGLMSVYPTRESAISSAPDHSGLVTLGQRAGERF